MHLSNRTQRLGLYRLALAGSLLVLACACHAQRPKAPPVPGSGSLRAGALAERARIQRGRELLELYLRQGLRQRYVAEQTVRLLEGEVTESRQVIRSAGLARQRIEYSSPPTLKGEVLLLIGSRLLHYRPAANRIFEGIIPVDELQNRARDLLEGLRTRKLSVRAVGEQQVAGQDAAIVEVRPLRPGGTVKRLYIDTKTGVRLRMEDLDANGAAVRETFYTRIDYSAPVDDAAFRPDSLPDVPHAPVFPRTPPLPGVQAAQAQVGYTIREPAVPAGFSLDGVWVIDAPGGTKATLLRYTDSVNAMALILQPAPAGMLARRAQQEGWFRFRNGSAQWIADGILYTLVGASRPEVARRMARSLRG